MEEKKQETYIDRMSNEYNELSVRLNKALAFIDSEKFNELPDKTKNLLKIQAEAMNQYQRILECRIADALNNNIDRIEQLPFGTVISALKAGFIACRKGWNGKGLFVFKQVRATITGEETIKKMTSLNSLSKQLITETNGNISYCNQCLIYNANTGEANSWVPSVSDIFADDWCIISRINITKIGIDK